MSNIFVSPNDLIFKESVDKLFEALRDKYKGRLARATPEGLSFVKTKIWEKLEANQRRLYTNAKLLTDIKNQYKLRLIHRFLEVLKERRVNPVLVFLKVDVPKLRSECKAHSKRSEFSYSFDHDFFNATSDEVIRMLADYQANEKYKAFLSEDTLETIGDAIEEKEYIKLVVPAVKRDAVLETIYKRLQGKFPNTNLYQLKEHFTPSGSANRNKVRWFGDSILLVYLLQGLMQIKIILEEQPETYMKTHFLNKHGKEFLDKKIIQTQAKADKTKLRGKEVIDQLLKELKELNP